MQQIPYMKILLNSVFYSYIFQTIRVHNLNIEAYRFNSVSGNKIHRNNDSVWKNSKMFLYTTTIFVEMTNKNNGGIMYLLYINVLSTWSYCYFFFKNKYYSWLCGMIFYECRTVTFLVIIVSFWNLVEDFLIVIHTTTSSYYYSQQ